ncbi:MAG: ExbD/TolR family protein [Planctomycetota bacterium]|jgi:biopolymer transport protein ExbD
MPSKTAIKLRNEDPEIELPLSMIDVVFLLLIFFMCSMQFKSVEQKLDADLPKNEGQNPIPKQVEQPTEIRVKIYWANGQGQVIYNNKMAFPADWPGVRVPLSITGAHIAMKVNKLQIRKAAGGGPDLNELARTLRDLVARNEMPVVIDARASVPFRFVIGALDACARADARDVKFQAPPAPEGGGDDWWWM